MEGAWSDVSHGLYDRCECGHVHPEHSLFGTCRACLDCVDFAVPDQDLNEGPDHDLRQCECRRFVLAAGQTADPEGLAVGETV